MSQLEEALALLFSRFREHPVPENDLVKAISLSLNWSKPSQAVHLLARGVKEGLVTKRGDLFEPAFSPDEVEVSFGFRPEDALFEPTKMPQGDPAPDVAEQGAQTSPAPASAEPTPAQAPTEEGKTEGSDPAPSGAQTPQAPPASPDGQRPALEDLLDLLAAHVEEGRKGAVAAVNAKQDSLDGAITLDAAALLVAAEHGLDVAEHARRVLEAIKA